MYAVKSDGRVREGCVWGIGGGEELGERGGGRNQEGGGRLGQEVPWKEMGDFIIEVDSGDGYGNWRV